MRRRCPRPIRRLMAMLLGDIPHITYTANGNRRAPFDIQSIFEEDEVCGGEVSKKATAGDGADETSHRGRSSNDRMVKSDAEDGRRPNRSESSKSEGRTKSQTKSSVSGFKQSCGSITNVDWDSRSDSRWIARAPKSFELSSRNYRPSSRSGPYLQGPYLPDAMSKATRILCPPPRDFRMNQLLPQPAVGQNTTGGICRPTFVANGGIGINLATLVMPHAQRYSDTQHCSGEARDRRQPPACRASTTRNHPFHGDRCVSLTTATNRPPHVTEPRSRTGNQPIATTLSNIRRIPRRESNVGKCRFFRKPALGDNIRYGRRSLLSSRNDDLKQAIGPTKNRRVREETQSTDSPNELSDLPSQECRPVSTLPGSNAKSSAFTPRDRRGCDSES